MEAETRVPPLPGRDLGPEIGVPPHPGRALGPETGIPFATTGRRVEPETRVINVNVGGLSTVNIWSA